MVDVNKSVVTLTVAECGEFHDFGKYHEGIVSVEEAIAIYRKIPPERINGIPSIGLNIHTEGTKSYEDVQVDLFSGDVIDLDVLDYASEITSNKKAMEIITELIEKLPDAEVLGSLEKYNPLVKVEEVEEENYNMIDGILNNEKPKKELERSTDRISIKEKLAEKRMIAQRRKNNGKFVQEIDKKTEREM